MVAAVPLSTCQGKAPVVFFIILEEEELLLSVLNTRRQNSISKNKCQLARSRWWFICCRKRVLRWKYVFFGSMDPTPTEQRWEFGNACGIGIIAWGSRVRGGGSDRIIFFFFFLRKHEKRARVVICLSCVGGWSLVIHFSVRCFL